MRTCQWPMHPKPLTTDSSKIPNLRKKGKKVIKSIKKKKPVEIYYFDKRITIGKLQNELLLMS